MRGASYEDRIGAQGEAYAGAEAGTPKMTNDELSIDLKPEDGGETLAVALGGSMDIATSPTVRAALSDAIDGGANHLIVDLTRLEFLDSTGLGVLIGAHRRVAERDGSLRLIVNEGPISRLLNITGLVAVFAVYRSPEDARRDRGRLGAPV